MHVGLAAFKPLKGMYEHVMPALCVSPLVCTGNKVQVWTGLEPELLQITSTLTAICTIPW